MKKQLTLAALAFISAAVFYQCSSCEKHKEETTKNDIKPDPKCAKAPDSWFAGATTPAPDDYGPFVDTSKTTDCDFHLWSFQKFLSLTRSADGKAPFEGLVQVSNDLELRGAMLDLTDITQAGTHGSLYDKNNSPIYYSIHVNQQMYDYQQKYLSLFAKNIQQNKDTVLAPGDTVNINNLHALGLDTLNYPVGSIEIKASWIMASSLKPDERKDYYITKAIFGAPDVMPVEVALLGMHIVGRVANHPEQVWATFEHDDLAPDYDWSTGKDTTTKVVSDKNFLFYNANTTVANCPMNNTATSPAKFTNVFNMFKYGMAEEFTGSFVPSRRDSLNNANIEALNESVKKQLREKDKGPWSHYFYKGSMWLDDPTPASFAPGNFSLGILTNPFLRGSRAISNITMETFAQVNFSGNYASGSMNCFACHGTVDFRNDTTRGVNYNMALSHLFINALLHKFHPAAAKTP